MRHGIVRGRSCPAGARIGARGEGLGEGDVYRGEYSSNGYELKGMGLAALAAWNRVRVAYPEVLLASRMAQLTGLFQARRPPHRRPRASAPPAGRASASVVEVVDEPADGRSGPRGMPSGSGSLAGCTTASRAVQRVGAAWIHISHQHTHLFTGQATRDATISARRHGASYEECA